MSAAEEAAIRQLLDDLCEAWNRGDAEAFGARYRDDGTFTNVFGAVHIGRDEFIRRHADVSAAFSTAPRSPCPSASSASSDRTWRWRTST